MAATAVAGSYPSLSLYLEGPSVGGTGHAQPASNAIDFDRRTRSATRSKGTAKKGPHFNDMASGVPPETRWGAPKAALPSAGERVGQPLWPGGRKFMRGIPTCGPARNLHHSRFQAALVALLVLGGRALVLSCGVLWSLQWYARPGLQLAPAARANSLSL